MMRALVIVLALVACKGKSAPEPAAASGSKPVEKTNPLGDNLPEVKDGFEPVKDNALTLMIGRGIMTLDGKPVLPLADGVVAPESREGGAMGMKIPRLSTLLAAHAQQSPDRTLQLVVDKTVPYRTLIEAMYSAKQKEAGYKNFQILARSNGKLVQAPIVLPDPKQKDDAYAVVIGYVQEGDGGDTRNPKRPGADLAKQIEDARNAKPGKDLEKPQERPPLATAIVGEGSAGATGRRPGGDLAKQIESVKNGGASAPPPADMPVGVVVALTKDATILWSTSGLEGTLQSPKLRTSDVAALKAAVDEIVQRRWAGKKEREQTIVLMADGDTPMQRIAETIAAVRPAFPDVTFSMGFE